MFALVDNFLLSYHQMFASWFQKQTGKTCFWLARICAHCAAVCLIVFLWLVYGRIQGGGLQVGGAIDLLLLVFLGHMYFCIYDAKEREEQYEKEGVHSSEDVVVMRESLWHLSCRLMSVALCANFMWSFVTAGFTFPKMTQTCVWFFIVTTEYFLICTPLPPRELRDWVNRIRKVVQGA